MRWYQSLITKVTIIFLLAFFGIGALFYSLASYSIRQDIAHTENFVRALVRNSFQMNRHNFNPERLLEAGFKIVEDESLQKTLFRKMQNTPSPRGRRGMQIKAINYERNIYVFMRMHMEQKNIFLQSPIKKSPFPRVIIPLLAFSLLTLLYVAIIRSILPLYSLRKKVRAFADGDNEIICTSDKKDEIAALANEFDKSVKKISKLRESRRLFLRNVMHELKTPITKGKIASELLEDSNYKESLQNVFRRQETLLEEFSRIEKLNANELIMDKRDYNIEDIIDFTLDILPHDSNQVKKEIIEPVLLKVDFELFGTALKNLLDNGINYSFDKSVSLHVDKDAIIISNKADALEFPLDKYAEPYFLGGKKQRGSRGLGFGLYITWHILKAHNLKFTYAREDETNNFIISI